MDRHLVNTATPDTTDTLEALTPRIRHCAPALCLETTLERTSLRCGAWHATQAVMRARPRNHHCMLHRASLCIPHRPTGAEQPHLVSNCVVCAWSTNLQRYSHPCYDHSWHNTPLAHRQGRALMLANLSFAFVCWVDHCPNTPFGAPLPRLPVPF